MEGGEGPAQPPTSETTSGKDKSADPRGRNKCSNCPNVRKTYKRSRRSSHRRHRRHRRPQNKISALKASRNRVRRGGAGGARNPVRRYCLINVVRATNNPETQERSTTTTSQDSTTTGQQAHPEVQPNQDQAASREAR
ncbi:uncharacterized protein LOC127674807 isoform X2 [Apodemus sylvaticus]|nr:uncharacterized protein LOC127674807 isoform X2 [Apodemus sylvaticus]XP_052026502.1 uncharacterized protein LOC127674807 isoform X2 [Apodemus sylvaticus]XP_052026503.1 uncharacterized protein LOC127674807 isoform X2 [Apodemus sylvaticus]XP_052026504.1 uncharacterized protein LOC127674807 isoform X2 [Apodemus sylvaticus]